MHEPGSEYRYVVSVGLSDPITASRMTSIEGADGCFAVYDEPGHVLLREIWAAQESSAYSAAVDFAESRGLPWSIKGRSVIFDPATQFAWLVEVPRGAVTQPQTVARQ